MTEHIDEGMIPELTAYCQRSGETYRSAGRRYYALAYLLTVITVLASISAGMLAIWTGENVPTPWIGTIALIPAASASIASQLKLVEKANWFYNCSTEYKALSREMMFLAASTPSPQLVEAAIGRLNQTERQADRGWSERLSFFFDKPAQAS